MSSKPFRSQHITDWLRLCDEAMEKQQCKPLTGGTSPGILNPHLKRNLQDMDNTPRAKRQATGVATPSTSNAGESRAHRARDSKIPSLRSSAPTSRSSSPTKRQREAEFEFSKPDFDFHTRSDSRQWKEKNTRGVPLMKELLESIYTNDIATRATPKVLSGLEKILKEIEKCKNRNATEDAWSDTVIFPTLRLARKLSHYKEHIDIINVKAIDVWPIELLPTNAQSGSIGKKRVDYTIGLEIADHDQIRPILSTVEDHTLNQTDHKMLRDRALCSHLEIKTERSPDDARFQLSTWCAAGFQKQENLWLWRYRDLQQPPPLVLAPIPLWLWKERNVQLWVAVMDSKNTRVHLLDEKTFFIDEEDMGSLLKVVATIAAVMEWGQRWYLPWLKEFIGWDEEAIHQTATENNEAGT